MTTKKVIIIGAGPGGLAAAMRLIYHGYQVEIYEKNNQIGGRTGILELGNYRFDIGPASITMPHVFTALFMECGLNIRDYINFIPIQPTYELHFGDLKFSPSDNQATMLREINKAFPGNEENYLKFMTDNAKKMLFITPLNESSFSSLFDYFKPNMIRAIPSLHIGRNLSDEISRYFYDKRLRLAFSFQTKYLGMAPEDTPAAYSVIPFAEYYYGTYHTTGGQHLLTKTMADYITNSGGKIFLNSKVTDFEIKNRTIQSMTLSTGEKITGDAFFINGDFAYSMLNLFKNKRPFKKKKIEASKYSASGFVIYLGLDKQFPIAHQTVLFKNTAEDNIIHITNPSPNDTSLAPIGHSSIRIIVYVPNNKSATPWNDIKQTFRDKIMKQVQTKLDLPDLENHIVCEKVITPIDWENDYHLHLGALFGMQQTFSQLGPFRMPSMLSRRMKNAYIVGRDAHPGSSLPTILEGAAIATKLFMKRMKK
ncbi:NAD(P)/FAD-dependent oxidoreductase [Listeria sp. PSOL-1]|uniref:phytoene desaturase family protein n=1 Tax=Listeria sp. PSOL-1 TaxID=1844999 RepID=UPI0013D02D66|nr:phytoene desaturase family protein [Listeria sp. PSOL-1]